jgi:hypothetical protein
MIRFALPVVSQTRLFSKNVDAAVPSYEVPTKFGDDYDTFVKAQSKEAFLPIDALCNFVKSSLLTRSFTFGEHLDYQPVIEELAVCLVDWRKTNDVFATKLDHARTLLQFGTQYDVQNQQFWSVVLEIAEEKIEATSNNFLEVFSFVSLLKENNLGTNRIMRSTADFIQFVGQMTPSELVKFTILFTSDDMQQAFDIHKVAKKKDPEGKTLLDTLEDALVQHADQFTVMQFATIANSIGYSYTDESEDMIHFDRFLEASRDKVISWLNNDQITDVESLIQIVMAFCESYPEDMDPVLFESLEY